ncbi:DUF5107 domain-containing protein [Pedobacter sp. Leaf194]|uniref:DUF5107 domain-containing protein n=1 Tax=Pedobacter sp. Leaf194 TaxID=1736297 RepID=UPI00070283B9|nr:DUF5107 domain-containing protein [Pedobacter sp. Leaf194]KQS41810.1 hypothetical protein ASG14_05015 [Pedobacter sp. Leaf194]
MDEKQVSVWEQAVTIPTYEVGKPNKNPMFFENRVYQGSSGVVYPHAIIEKISDDKQDKTYKGLFLENQYIKIMVLPELGGRIQMAYDKIKQRHFIYYNHVIKPALVGLTGPWISGGIEFNWPQHHRPSTFDPVDYAIEEHADGSKTIWVNEVEQMFHTKGMAGFTLYPDKAYIEISAKLLNRSELPQTFLWWANPAVKVNDYYQSVFPPDVNAVFDHGKRDVSSFPIAKGTYYKVDYAPGTDISMYKNIPVPTSYMAINSQYDFVGGYEHDTQAGMLHVANHHVSPGKKQWTWGNGDFGQAWDRNLTDEDGPYIELMTGMFTDNQPDFTWLMPNEEKSFKQYFLPYRELGVLQNASKDVLLSLANESDGILLKIQVTSLQKSLQINLFCDDQPIFSEQTNIDIEAGYSKFIPLKSRKVGQCLRVEILDENNRALLRYNEQDNKNRSLPEAAKAAPEPQEVSSVEMLFLHGQHLEQYRHATYKPVDYYQEALRREPGDIRSNNALGLWYLRRGQFSLSQGFFEKAIETSILRNPNPYDSEPYYNLGLTLRFQSQDDLAYTAFYKATWSKAMCDNAFFALARIDLTNHDYSKALDHLSRSLDNNANNSKAYVLRSAAMRKSLGFDKAYQVCEHARDRDKFNLGAIYEQMVISAYLSKNEDYNKHFNELLSLSRGSIQNIIEYAIDYAWAGLYDEAIDMLLLFIEQDDSNPMAKYHLGYFYNKKANYSESIKWFGLASAADSYRCFPNRLEEILVLNEAIKANPTDAMAPYYLGNLFYDKRQYQLAIDNWELSLKINNSFPTVYRNLGIAYFNKHSNFDQALEYFVSAFRIDPTDDRLCMELHQLYKRLNYAPKFRLEFLRANFNHVIERDDLYLELITLLNLSEDFSDALDMIGRRRFHPWEGGEGKVSGQYVFSCIELAKIAIREGDIPRAENLLTQARKYPQNLGEGKLFGTRENDIFYWLGLAMELKGDINSANKYFLEASEGNSEPGAAIFYNDQQPDKIFYQGLAQLKLGARESALAIFNNLIDYGREHLNDEVKIDYFAVSLPDMMIFDDDLQRRHKIHCNFVSGLGYLGLGDKVKAKIAFNDVLSADSSHLAASLHLRLAEEKSLLQVNPLPVQTNEN